MEQCVLQGELIGTHKLCVEWQVSELKRRKKLKSKFALAAVSAILVVSLAANAYFYAQQYNSAPDNDDAQKKVADLQSKLTNLREQANNLQSGNANLTAQVASLESQVANLSNQTNSLQTENSNLQSEKASLQSQLSQLSQGKVPPRLVTRLGARELRYNYSGQDLRLYITGEVWNVGAEAAVNCSLHVTLYQGDTVAEDTYIELGTINGGLTRKWQETSTMQVTH